MKRQIKGKKEINRGRKETVKETRVKRIKIDKKGRRIKGLRGGRVNVKRLIEDENKINRGRKETVKETEVTGIRKQRNGEE